MLIFAKFIFISRSMNKIVYIEMISNNKYCGYGSPRASESLIKDCVIKSAPEVLKKKNDSAI